MHCCVQLSCKTPASFAVSIDYAAKAVIICVTVDVNVLVLAVCTVCALCACM